MPGLVKRSLMLDGHRTSVALEPEFWAALEDGARAEGMTLATLVAAIDRTRAAATPDRLLASACRVWALERATRPR
jgi:predicted DNA-binding ribbon-helix-helix protein